MDDKPEELKPVPMQRWIDLPNGYGLFDEKSGAGGTIYSTDEIGGGVVVWDTTLVAASTVLAALVREHGMLRVRELLTEVQHIPLRVGNRRVQGFCVVCGYTVNNTGECVNDPAHNSGHVRCAKCQGNGDDVNGSGDDFFGPECPDCHGDGAVLKTESEDAAGP